MHDVPCSLELVQRVELQPAQVGHCDDNMLTACAAWLPTHARAFDHEGRIIGCFGVFPIRKGVAEAWAALSDEIVTEHPVQMGRTVRNWLWRVEIGWKLRRIQAAVAREHDAGHRWIRWLGFQAEGVMRNYGIDGRGDFVLYARVP